MIAEAVRHMLAAGMSHQAIVAAVADMEASISPDVKRSAGAIRTARWRENKASQTFTERHIVTDVTESVTAPPSLDKEIPPTPPKEIKPIPAYTHEGRAKPWACPSGVDPAHWRDFLANRRRKRLTNTETAYHGQIRLIEKHADDDWPPGRLVQISAEKGWGTIVDPHEHYGDTHAQRTANGHRKPHRRSDEIDDAADFLGFER